MTDEEMVRAAVEAAEHTNGQSGGMASQGVPPQPVPLSVQLTTVTHGVEKFVVLMITSPVGQHVYFLDPDGAEKVADAILDAARTVRTGLEIPRSVV